MEKCLIVAVAENGAIGRNNDLLWHIREDLRFFKRTTMGCPVIMGRRTFESIGRALPGRLNIVVSSGSPTVPEGVVVARSLEEAYAAAEGSGAERCFITGGGRLYAAAMDTVDTMYITHVKVSIPDADTFFPAVDYDRWIAAERSELFKDEESGYEYEFVTYKRNLTWKENHSAADSVR